MTKQENLELKLAEKCYLKTAKSIKTAVLTLADDFDEEYLINLYVTLSKDYYRKHPELAFGVTMIEDEKKNIHYKDGTNENSRSEGIKVKTDIIRGTTKKVVKHNITGIKRSNERNTSDESVYKKRVAVHASHLREHANWKIGSDLIEELIKTSVKEYTEKYNRAFGTNFKVHYPGTKKDWVSWYTGQLLKSVNLLEDK